MKYGLDGFFFFRFLMEKFNLLLELCQGQCREVPSVSAAEAAKFENISIVRGVTCYYKVPLLQQLSVECTDLAVLKESFTNWGEEKQNVEFPGTSLLTALMPTKDVNDISKWFHSAIVPIERVYEPVLLVATGNCLTGFHVDNSPPTEIVASLLRGRKLWIFASHGSKSAARLVKRKEETEFQQFIEDLMFHRFQDLLFCVQEPGDTVCFPARTVHFVLSVTAGNEWNCLLSHNISHREEVAAAMEVKAYNRCSGSASRIVQGKRTKRSGVTKTRFTSRRRTQNSSK